MRAALTDRAVSTSKPGDLFDAKQPGLNLRTTSAGVRTWFLVFTASDRKRARVRLGRYPEVPLSKARTLALEARAMIEEGRDPRDTEAPAPAPAVVTVAMEAENYIKRHGCSIKTGKDLARRLRVDVLPIIGTIELGKLHRRDLHRVLDAINDRGSPQAAAKAFGDMRALLKWAVQRGDLDADPMAAMETPPASKPRERFLTQEEIAALWPSFPASVALPLKLALVTGQRIGEVTGITLDEIDFPKAIWNLPKERSKNAAAHSIPLSAMALKIIAEARTGAIGARLFPGLNSMKVGQQLIRYRDRLPVSDWAAHDLRRTCCTHLATMGVSPLVIAACVNHRGTTKSGVTMSTYVRYDYAKEKREALELWADRLQAIIGGDHARVIPMTRKA